MSYYVNSTHNLIEQDELFLLIETGIKFFLFQRGQIPLPYERLRTACTPCTTDREIIFDDQHDDRIGERINMIKVQRKLRRREMLLAQRNKRLVELETAARTMFDGVFKRLRCIFLSPYVSHVTAVVLVFGSSIYHQKEIITFRIDPALTIAKNVDSSDEMNRISSNIRSFCKAIIMSPEFVEFTDKSLRPTVTQMLLLTNQQLEQEGLILVHDHQLVLNHSNLSRKRLFCVNLKLHKTHETMCTTENPPDLYCYQLPCRFKGIHVRNSHSS